MSEKLDLQGECSETSYDAWRELVEGDPKNQPFEKKLCTELDEGIVVQPLYTAATQPEAASPWTRGSLDEAGREGWELLQPIDGPSPEDAARQLSAELERGATGARLIVAGGSRSGGVELDGLDDWLTVLEPVGDRSLRLVVDAGAAYLPAAAFALAAWRRLGREAHGSLGADPIGALAVEGEIAADALDSLGKLGRWVAEAHPELGVAIAASAPYHDAGASADWELGATFSAAVAYLRALREAGLSVEEAVRRIDLRFSVGADIFLEIAKLRVARRLWARIQEASGVAAPKLRIEAETSWRMMSVVDPWVNMLRTTAATFAASAGGASSLTVLPFDSAVGVPDRFGRRIARNTQHILMEESGIHRVLDPGGGSYYLEALSEQLAERAWARFQELEAQGGVLAALQKGSLQQVIRDQAEKTAARIATRKQPITGVNEFPHLHEERLEREERKAPRARALVSGDVQALVDAALAGTSWEKLGAGSGAEVLRGEALPRRRWSAAYERLRDASDAHFARTGERPKVFLACLGPLAEHTARATWTRNFFAAGGIEARGDAGAETAQQAAEAFAASGATVAVLCGSDERYGAIGEEAVRALREAGARSVYVAGKPGEREEAWRQAGVDRFVHVGVDVLETLRATLDLLGVEVKHAS